jgi:hypothetical protein
MATFKQNIRIVNCKVMKMVDMGEGKIDIRPSFFLLVGLREFLGKI